MNQKITASQISNYLGIQVYLVGGAVRDQVMGKIPKDYDFATPANPEQIQKAIQDKGRRAYLMGKRFGTIGFRLPVEEIESKASPNPNLDNDLDNIKDNGIDNISKEVLDSESHKQKPQKAYHYIEITTFRTEQYNSGSRKPVVEFTEQFEEDMARRDFTINAMAIKPDGSLWDGFGGQEDINNKLIRAVGKPKMRFKEDPLRILRAVRFATRYNYQIESKTLEYCQKMRFELLNVSRERWVLELDKILADDNVYYGLQLLIDGGLWQVMIPHLHLQKNYNQNSPYHDFELWEHTSRVISNVPKQNLDLRWTALLHDIAKPYVAKLNPKGHTNYIHHETLGRELAKQVCKYLNFSGKRTSYILEQIQNHLQADSDLKLYDDAGKKISSKS